MKRRIAANGTTSGKGVRVHSHKRLSSNGELGELLWGLDRGRELLISLPRLREAGAVRPSRFVPAAFHASQRVHNKAKCMDWTATLLDLLQHGSCTRDIAMAMLYMHNQPFRILIGHRASNGQPS